jgi:acetamidase/formamidase
MARREVLPSPETVHWGYFDASIAPVATIDPGDFVVMNSVSGDRDQTPADPRYLVRPALTDIQTQLKPDLGPHILTGPVFVRGAEPGDALSVKILDFILPDNWGFNLIMPDMGAIPADFPYERLIHLPIDQARRVVGTPWGMEIPAKPFFGVMGAAPKPADGRRTSVIPDYFGGNIDNKELGAGSTLVLPVSTPGALFSVGDGHAAQGDGEVCLTAVETGLVGTMRIDLIKGAHLEAPYAETPTHLIAMAFNPDLDEAARVALRRMIAMIAQRAGISSEDAYRLCSLAADLRITQVVNVSKGVHVMLPRQYLEK